MFTDDDRDRATLLLAMCRTATLKLATAESCTGGLIAALLTDIAGSSDVVERGFVTYSNEAKTELLGVPADLLAQYGAVSRETALAMVRGALQNSRAQIAVAVTGVAGPGGGSPDKPVGLVHLAAARSDGRTWHREMRYGDVGRVQVREATMRTALDVLAEAARP